MPSSRVTPNSVCLASRGASGSSGTRASTLLIQGNKVSSTSSPKHPKPIKSSSFVCGVRLAMKSPPVGRCAGLARAATMCVAVRRAAPATGTAILPPHFGHCTVMPA